MKVAGLHTHMLQRHMLQFHMRIFTWVLVLRLIQLLDFRAMLNLHAVLKLHDTVLILQMDLFVEQFFNERTHCAAMGAMRQCNALCTRTCMRKQTWGSRMTD